MKKIIQILSFGILMLGILLVGTGCGKEESSEQIVVFNYGDYIEKSLIDKFEKKTGIKVVYEEFLTPEAMYTKYETKAVDYDVICCSDYMVEKMIQEGNLEEIDIAGMENYENLDEKYLELSRTFDPENKYSIPYLWGTVGILYNTEMVKEEPDSWDIFWDEQYKDNMILQNSVRDTFIPALKKLRYSINTSDKGELSQAKELVMQQKPLVQSYLVDEIRDDMANEQAAIALIYSGEASVAMDYNDKLAYTIPKEGSNVWIDSWMIPKGGKNKEGAQMFLDFLCSEEASLANFEYIYYGTPNKLVFDKLDEEIQNDPCIFPGEEVLENCEIFKYPGRETEQYYNAIWKEIKAD